MNGALKVAIAATSIAISTAAPAAADTALYVGGTGTPRTPTQSQMTWLQNGVYAGRDDILVGVGYPATLMRMDDSIAVGVTELGTAITNTPGPKTVVGVSQGSLVVHEEQRRLMTLPAGERPADHEVRFVYIADPARPSGGITNWVPEGLRIPGLRIGRPEPLIDTPFETVYVTREYDGIADFPDRPLNLVATANALMGGVYLHPSYGVDLTNVPKSNITETTNTAGGRTIDYLVPTKELPLTQPLRQLGVPRRIVDDVDEVLRPVINAGYKRNDRKPKAGRDVDTKPATTAHDDDDDDAPASDGSSTDTDNDTNDKNSDGAESGPS